MEVAKIRNDLEKVVRKKSCSRSESMLWTTNIVFGIKLNKFYKNKD